MGAGAIGFLFGPLNLLERLAAIVAASFLVAALPMTDEIGLAEVVAFLAWHVWRTGRTPQHGGLSLAGYLSGPGSDGGAMPRCSSRRSR